jgi:outer membrane lipopolysaccharide assembly protein LptE/RlpB
VKEYSKVIYMKFKPEEVEILHDRMKEAGVQNMSAYIRKIQKRESELIKSVSVALRFIRSSRGLGHFPQQAKMRRVYTRALLANLRKNERKDFIYEKFRKRTEAWKKWNRKSVH